MTEKQQWEEKYESYQNILENSTDESIRNGETAQIFMREFQTRDSELARQLAAIIDTNSDEYKQINSVRREQRVERNNKVNDINALANNLVQIKLNLPLIAKQKENRDTYQEILDELISNQEKNAEKIKYREELSNEATRLNEELQELKEIEEHCNIALNNPNATPEQKEHAERVLQENRAKQKENQIKFSENQLALQEELNKPLIEVNESDIVKCKEKIERANLICELLLEGKTMGEVQKAVKPELKEAPENKEAETEGTNKEVPENKEIETEGTNKEVPENKETNAEKVNKANQTERKKIVDVNTWAEQLYEKMDSELKQFVIYAAMTGENEEYTKRFFDKIQELYGADIKEKASIRIKELVFKEFLKVSKIKIDVTTGMITVIFNCGEKFNPVNKIDLRKANSKSAKMESIKAMQKKIDPNIKYEATIADPYIIKALSDATKKQFEKLGVSSEKINIEDIQRQVDLYQKELTSKYREFGDRTILYEKSNKEQPIKAGARKFEKVLRPFLKVAEKSAYVQIDDSIQTMTITDRMKRMLGKSWDWLIGENKKLPAGKYLKQEEKTKDDELTKVARNLGIEAQMKIVSKKPVAELEEQLPKEQEEKVNEDLLRQAEKRNAPKEIEEDREDR